jgi:hypothetical protein
MLSRDSYIESHDCLAGENRNLVCVAGVETVKNTHLFWFAQVLGVFHASVFNTDTESATRFLNAWSSYEYVG